MYFFIKSNTEFLKSKMGLGVHTNLREMVHWSTSFKFLRFCFVIPARNVDTSSWLFADVSMCVL